MISIEKLLVFIHVGGAVVWIGSAVALELIKFARSRSGREGLVETISLGAWFGPRVFMPASLTTLVSGILLVALGKPSFSQAWVIFALSGIVISAALGGGVIGRITERLKGLFSAPNADETEIARNLRRLNAFSYFNLAILTSILFDMVVRPDASNTVFYAVIALFLAIVAGFSFRRKNAAA